jgi:hypothetical protein
MLKLKILARPQQLHISNAAPSLLKRRAARRSLLTVALKGSQSDAAPNQYRER